MNRFTLADLCHVKGTTLKEVAEQINLDRKTLSRWSSHKVMPSLENAVKLAKALNVTLNEIVEVIL